MRPINFVVDISNYVMLEIGQPSHAFDADLVPDGLLRVRRATEGEQVETLDGVLRTLRAGDGVIADASDRPIGIAGVMGGASTEISEGTDVVLLEAAWWNPPDIARTSRRLGLRSEASARNEAGVDPEIAPWALERFAELAAAGGVTLAPDLVQAQGHLPPRATVRVRTGRVNAILGTSLTTGRDALLPGAHRFRNHPVVLTRRAGFFHRDALLPGAHRFRDHPVVLTRRAGFFHRHSGGGRNPVSSRPACGHRGVACDAGPRLSRRGLGRGSAVVAP